MSKQVRPQELAEIVTGLLVNPELFGELCERQQYESFMLAIGQAVADHCGGQVNQVNSPFGDTVDVTEEDGTPYLSVSPDDSLPSLTQNVWAAYDPEGWEDELRGEGSWDAWVDCRERMKRRKMRSTLQCLLANAGFTNEIRPESVYQELRFGMVDWRIAEGTDTEEPGDERPYTVTARMGNQTNLDIVDDAGEPALSIIVEIDRGVPTIHIDPDGEEATLHIHKAQGGLVLTPTCRDYGFCRAEPDRFAYKENDSLVLRPANV